MIIRFAGGVVMAGVLGLMASDARAAQQQMTCPQIVTMSRFVGGKMSSDDLAKKLNADPEMVRNCLDKKPQEAKGVQAPAPATK